MIRKRTYHYGILVLLTVMMILLAGRGFAQAATPYEANGRLSVSGGNIINSKGKNFIIKGVSTHGIAWYPEYVSKAAFQTLRDKWGVNTIRLAMYTAEYNGYCTGGSQKELKKTIDNGVKYATELGMYVIIDWHILSDGNPLTYQTKADSFFRETAKKYAGYGNVLYEICNEPNGSGGSWTNIKSYARAIIKTIRSVNAKAILIVGTPTWSQDVDTAAASPITGYTNIAYAFHFYAATHQASMRTKLEGALKKGLPVIVTEFGISDASGGGNISTSQGNSWMRLLDQYQVGRVCWNLSNKDETSSLLKSSCTRKSGWTAADLSGSGKWMVETYTGKSADTGGNTSSAGSGSGSGDSGTGSSGSGSGGGSSTGGTGSSGGSSTGGTGSGGSGTGGTGSSSGGSSTGGTGSSSGGMDTGSTGTKIKTATSKGTVKIKAVLSKVSSWKSGSKTVTQYKLVLKNTGSRTNKTWKVVLKLKKSFQVTSKWCASMKRTGSTLVIKPLAWNKKLKKSDQTEIGLIISSAGAPSVKSMTVTAYTS